MDPNGSVSVSAPASSITLFGVASPVSGDSTVSVPNVRSVLEFPARESRAAPNALPIPVSGVDSLVAGDSTAMLPLCRLCPSKNAKSTGTRMVFGVEIPLYEEFTSSEFGPQAGPKAQPPVSKCVFGIPPPSAIPHH